MHNYIVKIASRFIQQFKEPDSASWPCGNQQVYTTKIKQKRVEITQLMLNVLTSEKVSHDGILTGDESWFY